MQSQRQCFLIDNDEDDREIFGLALREIDQNINCIAALNGIHALELLAKDPALAPAVVFIDMNMPMMNGTQCLQAIRKMDRFQQTPVYMLSTSSDPFIMEEARRLGANDFLVKPSSFTDWITLLSAVFQFQKLIT